MDQCHQGTGDFAQGQSAPLTDDVVVKVELPWSVKEEPQDQPSAVYSTAQPMSDNTSGSPLSGHVCQRCSAVFMLSSSLVVHRETFHGETQHSELPVASARPESGSENTDKLSNVQEGFSTQIIDDSTEDSATSSVDFLIKLEPPWSMKEEPQDQPSAVDSTVQPMSDNTSGSLLSLNTSHVCQRCSATFVLFSSLELHMVTFHGETLQDLFPLYSELRCSDVGYYSDGDTEEEGFRVSQSALEGRKEKAAGYGSDRTEEEKSKKRVCDECSETFPTHNDLKKHKMIHAGLQPFVCDACGKAFTNPGNLRKHRLIHTGLRAFVCDVCTKAFMWLGDLKRHQMIHTGQKPFVCDVCHKAFALPDYLKIHKSVHSGKKSFVCDVCSKAFTRENNLKRHRLIHTGDKQYVCDVCSKAFFRPGDLHTHKLNHIGHKPFECDMCNKAFTTSGQLKTHKLFHSDHKPFVCETCNKAFTTSGQLKRHSFSHSGLKPFMCDVCSKAFTTSCQLKTHKLLHTDEKLFACDVCNKAFTHANALNIHRLVHTQERPHKCPRCSTGFSQSGSLHRHIRVVHAGVQPYVCDTCGSSFHQIRDLKSHKRTHTDDKSYSVQV